MLLRNAGCPVRAYISRVSQRRRAVPDGRSDSCPQMTQMNPDREQKDEARSCRAWLRTSRNPENDSKNPESLTHQEESFYLRPSASSADKIPAAGYPSPCCGPFTTDRISCKSCRDREQHSLES